MPKNYHAPISTQPIDASPELLQLDETALYLFDQLNALDDEINAATGDVGSPIGSEMGRLDELIADYERTVSQIADHISLVLMGHEPYKLGRPGLSLKDARHIREMHARPGDVYRDAVHDAISNITIQR